MSFKQSIVLDSILRGIVLNRNNEVDYSASVVVELDKDVQFQYTIVDEGNEDNNLVHFTTAKRYAIIKHKNTDGVFKRKVLLLKSTDKANATVSIDIERLFTAPTTETLGPIRTVLLNNTAPGDEPTSKPWYKDPWILGAIFIVILLVVMVMNKNRGRSGLFG